MSNTLKYPRITVVTPNYNQANFIEKTIQSVINQDYPNLEYIIIDGGSTDGSVEIIKKYEKSLAYWESEPDNGMYHAINKGFSKATGEIMCWINSDDVLWEKSLFNVAKIMSSNKHIHWLQGFPSVINEEGALIDQREQVFSKYFFYWYQHEKSFAFVQQESTFWRKELWEKVGSSIDTNYTLAADFDLWMRFLNYKKMYCTQIQLGAFRKRHGQKSSNQELYLAETRTSIARNFVKLGISDKFVIKFGRLLKKLNTPLIIKFNNKFQKLLIGKPNMV